MVLDFPPEKNLPTNALAAMNGFLAGAVRDQGFAVITPADVSAVLGLERQRQLMGCAESSCLAELGGALGVDYIVRGTVAVLGSSTAITLSLVDKRGIAAGQVRELVPSADPAQLLRALEQMVPRLVAPVRPPGAAKADASKPAGGLVSSQEASASPGAGRGAGYALVGVGGAALVTSGIFGLLAQSNVSQMRDVVAGRASGDLEALHSTAQRDARISDWALAGGLVAGGVGAVLLLTSGAEPAAGSGGELGWRF